MATIILTDRERALVKAIENDDSKTAQQKANLIKTINDAAAWRMKGKTVDPAFDAALDSVTQ